MKKVVAFMVAILYLGLTSGLAVNMHYCMGKVAGVKFNSYKEGSCGCDSKEKMPCCNHQYHLVKVQDEHQQAAGDIFVKAPVIQLHSFDNLISAILNFSFRSKEYNSKPPPLVNNTGIYIRNCVFMI